MYKGLGLIYEYVIMFEDGTYYTGCSGEAYKGTKRMAYPYTVDGAHAKIERMGWKATVAFA